MKHTVHIMLGSNTGHILCNLKQYIRRYGSADAFEYIDCMQYVHGGTKSPSVFAEAVIKNIDDSVFVPGMDELYTAELKKLREIQITGRKEFLSSFFSELHKERITINNDLKEGPHLNLCLYIPVFEKGIWEQAKELIEIVNSIHEDYNTDLVLLPYDLAFIFNEDKDRLALDMKDYMEQTKATILSVLDYKKENPTAFNHALIIQNENESGKSLDLDKDAFVRILGEYAILAAVGYHKIFNNNAFDPTRPVYTMGISVLNFDKYYFVQYLLHKAYIHILDRENVSQESVDVNKVSKLVKDILKDNIDIFTAFYNKNVKTRLDNGDNEDEIISEISPQLRDEIDKLSKLFLSYIDRPDLSLPEKRAALAQLLGEDDDLLTGYIYDKKQPVVEDCSREILDLFVQLNNKLAAEKKETSEEADAGFPVEESLADYAVLSDDEEKSPVKSASRIVDELKEVKIAMKASSNYIREKSKEFDSVKSQIKEKEDSNKRLTENGFIFEGRTYQLQTGIVEQPLEENYVPKTGVPSQVDLRPNFTPIKDQGEYGACSAFTIVGIYEYILKKNEQKVADLSEAFAYYNGRKAANQETEDCGSSLYNVIGAIMEYGICSEEKFPYGNNVIIEPPADAYEDAASRKIVKALNVNVDIKDIKSALSEGYPVAISLKIYNSFVPMAGFIPKPKGAELNESSGNHAMIICGYSDTEKIFIVRNSWGTGFGDKGYCYIPYSYIGDPDFLNSACIITEINNKELVVGGGGGSKLTFAFDMTNLKIRYVILRGLIEEERVRMAALGNKFTNISKQYNRLLQSLGNNSARSALCEGSVLRLGKEIGEEQKAKSKKQEERENALQAFDTETRRISVFYGAFVALLVLIYGLICWFSSDPEKVLCNTFSYVVYGVAGVISIAFFLWLGTRRHGRVTLDMDYKDEIDSIVQKITEKEKEQKETHLKTHVAGMVIDSMSLLYKNLHSKYNGIKSCVCNLRGWQEEEQKNIRELSYDCDPFISLISKECLDKYFENNKDAITKQIKLYKWFDEDYEINEEKIVAFKNKLKDGLTKTMFEAIDNFSIYSLLTGERTYPYIPKLDMTLENLLADMDRKSAVFLEKNPYVESGDVINTRSSMMFIGTDISKNRNELTNLFDNKFSEKPALVEGDSVYNLVLFKICAMSPDEVRILN